MGIRITNATGDKPTLWCYGTIGDEISGFTADMLRNALSEIPKNQNFQIRIFSDGGSYDQGVLMHGHLSARGNKSHGIVDGIAASAASLLLQGTGRRSMVQHSRQMMHEVQAHVEGTYRAADFKNFVQQMDSTNATLMDIYSKNWKGTREELRQALADETWMNAAEAVERGMADDVVEGAAIAARVNIKLFDYKNIPDDVIKCTDSCTMPWIEELEKQLEDVLK